MNKKCIKNHISSNLKAKDVAATVNLSESYFTIYFKTKTGQNFRDYVLNARTEENVTVEIPGGPEMIGSFRNILVTGAGNWVLKGNCI